MKTDRAGGGEASFRRIYKAYEDLMAWADEPTFMRRSGFPDKWFYDGEKHKWVQPAPDPLELYGTVAAICFPRSGQVGLPENFFEAGFVGEHFLPGEPVKFVVEYKPFVGFVDIIVGNDVRYIFLGFKPGRCNPDVFRHVAAHFTFKGFQYCLNAVAGIKYIVHDEQSVFPIGIPGNILQAVDSDNLVSFVHAEIRRGSNGDVIRFNTQLVQNFLNRNAHRCTATPYGDDKTWAESAFENAQSEFK